MTSQPKEGVLANLDRQKRKGCQQLRRIRYRTLRRTGGCQQNQVSNVEEDRNLSEDEGLILPATKTLIR
ncbi:hypothetical protein M514_19490 [Trichuris suis]|uniref:Uncharacterized protein n=1 Tax=Trichuris suis TaxID=68888 RepID=A0A085NFI2_9BILA|nr:hypothetical protein M514_19490 [Trichuris suis]